MRTRTTSIRMAVLLIMILIFHGSGMIAGAQGLQPQGLKATVGEGLVTLRWMAPAAVVQGYIIYRASPDGNPKRLNPTPLTETFYQDLDVVAAQIYGYTVTAVDAAGQEGPASDQVQATLAGSGTASSGY